MTTQKVRNWLLKKVEELRNSDQFTFDSWEVMEEAISLAVTEFEDSLSQECVIGICCDIWDEGEVDLC